MITLETTFTDALTKMKEMNAGLIKLNIKGVCSIIIAGPDEAEEVTATIEALERRWESQES